MLLALLLSVSLLELSKEALQTSHFKQAIAARCRYNARARWLTCAGLNEKTPERRASMPRVIEWPLESQNACQQISVVNSDFYGICL